MCMNGASCSADEGTSGFTCTCTAGYIGQLCGDMINDGDVRLVAGSSSAGRLEIYHDGQWGTVCDDSFDSNNNGATVACRQLGFTSGTVVSRGTYGSGSGQIWLDQVSCTGTESTLAACPRNAWGDNDCGSHTEDVGVTCSISDGDLRLVGGTSNSGRLEIYHDGHWGTVCDDSFDSNNNGATVACRQLGFISGTVVSRGTYGSGSGQVWLDQVSCTGTESTLAACPRNAWGDNDCGSHTEDVGVTCTAGIRRRRHVPAPDAVTGSQTATMHSSSAGLIASHLGISQDLLISIPCNAPPDFIKPDIQGGCSSVFIPKGLTSYCATDQSCLSLGCCLPMDLGITTRSFQVWMRLDSCGASFTLGFENWVYSESLNTGFHFGVDHIKDIGHVTLRYRIMKPGRLIYHIDLGVMLCLDGVCSEPATIVKSAMITVQDCSEPARSRRRRQAAENDSSMTEGSPVDSDAISIDDKVKKYFQDLLDRNITTLSAEDNMMASLDPASKVPYVAPDEPTSRRQMGLFVLEDNDPSSK
ncbi:uncharacterized protein [Amphiura filiformis]|uniref:uncharacterized protein n=1 Tax=Amphiura filiformis TaxID=82378 RepID=UPI003B228D47